MKPKSRVFSPTRAARLLLGLLALSTLLTLPLPTSGAQSPPGPVAIYGGVSTAVKFDISPPLRDIPPAPEPVNFVDLDPDWGAGGPLGPQDVDPVQQTTVGPGEMPAPAISFDGFNNQLTYTPPDPDGDVGPNHYVAIANVHFAIYDKAGTLLYGPVPNNTLWSGFGGACENENAGDPIAIYDQFADRWMLTQFSDSTAPWYNCVALSTTPDPLGSYYRWAFQATNGFPDYPKYGVWSDAYYLATRENSIGAYALNRAQMLAGNPSPQVVSFYVPQNYNAGNGLLPADIDGTTLPPAGSPEIFMGTMDDGGPLGAPQDALSVWRFHVDWANPGNSTFVLAATLPTAAFDSIFPCSPTSRECIPQPGTSVKVDILSYRQRPLWRLAYRNFGTHESLVTNQSVEASTNMAGIRWYEVRNPNGTPFIYQQGTYNPGASDGIHRWMGSIAMDRDGNMMLGYSASNATSTYPSIWYTGRLATDPLGQMPQGEGSFQNGTGSQTSSAHRWGDYTSMNVDPVDDCTFWYVNEYYPTTSATAWRLHIGAAKFPSCGASGADLVLFKTDTPDPVAPGGTLTYTLSITNAGPNEVPSTVTVEDSLPAGFVVGSVSASGWTCNQAGQLLTCTRTSLPLGPYQIQVRGAAPAVVGYITNTAEITSTYADYNPTNNDSQARTLVDRPPVANDDSYTTAEDTPRVVAAPGVRGNDTDPDGGTLTVALGTPPAHGTLALASSGAFVYTPTLNYNGGDSFTYVLGDGYLTDTAIVSLTVTPVNDAPVAQNDSYTTPEDTPRVVAAPGVLSNDTDVDGDTLTAAVATDPQHGTVALATNGAFVYTPTANYNGPDSFVYIASDGALTDTATVNLTVTPVNDAPLAVDDAYTTTEDTPLAVAAPGVLANDSDVDGDALDAALDGGPLHGTVALAADGSFVYTPSLNYNGADVFTYTVSDGALSDVGVVYLTVTPVNDAPVAENDAYTVTEDVARAVVAPGVLANDSDVDGDALTAIVIADPQHGTLVLNGDGAFTYTPDLNYNGPDSFTYAASDGVLTGSAVVDLEIVPVNDAPIVDAGPDQEGAEGAVLSFSGSFFDPGLMSWVQAGESVLWNFDDGSTMAGTLTPTHAYGDNGVYHVTLVVTDSLGAMGEDTLVVTVTNVAPALAPLPDVSVALGDALPLDGSFADPGWLDTHTVTIDWGDGVTETHDLAAGVVDFSTSYTYGAAGVYTATVAVADDDGGQDSLAFTVTVTAPETFQVYLPVVYR